LQAKCPRAHLKRGQRRAGKIRAWQ
jgi:hypothetical protein